VGPFYYPDHVGAIGGMIGGLGGFALPIALGALHDLTAVSTGCFMLLSAWLGMALLSMRFALRRMARARLPELETRPELPELLDLQPPAPPGRTRAAIRPGTASLAQPQRASGPVGSGANFASPWATAPSGIAQTPAGH
jgi:hypothetical protein